MTNSPDRCSADSLELKPCPFCGGQAGYYAAGEAVFKMNWTGHVCHCKNCQARVSTTAGMEAAAAMWNARALTSITAPAQPAPEIQNVGNEAVISDIPWAVNYLLEQIAAKFDGWDTFDLFRSEAAATVRSFKHDLAAQPPAAPVETDRALAEQLWAKLCTDCAHVAPEKCDCLDDILAAFAAARGEKWVSDPLVKEALHRRPHDGSSAATEGEPVNISGWKLVPDAPTEAMWQAGRNADIHPGDSYSKVWRAMFEAAPDVEDCETTSHATEPQPSAESAPSEFDLTVMRERDEARQIVAEANNSLYGSQGYFHSLTGGPFDKYHLSRGVERLKAMLKDEPQPVPDIAAGMKKAMEIVGEMRMSEAGIFDEKHSGQRGEDRSNALYDAYVAIRSALSRPPL